MLKVLYFSLFPSWKLFNETFEIPILMYETNQNSWEPLFENRPAHIKELIFNPEGNIYLLIQSRIHRILDLLSTNPNFNIELDSNYLFFKKLVYDKLRDSNFNYYRFKLHKISTNEDIIISKIYYGI